MGKGHRRQACLILLYLKDVLESTLCETLYASNPSSLLTPTIQRYEKFLIGTTNFHSNMAEFNNFIWPLFCMGCKANSRYNGCLDYSEGRGPAVVSDTP